MEGMYHADGEEAVGDTNFACGSGAKEELQQLRSRSSHYVPNFREPNLAAGLTPDATHSNNLYTSEKFGACSI